MPGGEGRSLGLRVALEGLWGDLTRAAFGARLGRDRPGVAAWGEANESAVRRGARRRLRVLAFFEARLGAGDLERRFSQETR